MIPQLLRMAVMLYVSVKHSVTPDVFRAVLLTWLEGNIGWILVFSSSSTLNQERPGGTKGEKNKVWSAGYNISVIPPHTCG